MSTEVVSSDGEVIVSEAKPCPLMGAILEARKLMGPVAKSGYNDFDNYNYSTLKDYLDVVTEPCLQHGILIFASEGQKKAFTTNSQKMPNGWQVEVIITLHHVPTGIERTWVETGEAYDKGDKGLYKAKTGGRKFGLQDIFNLYGEDDPERDSVPDDDRGRRRQPENQGSRQQRQQRQPSSRERSATQPASDAKPATQPAQNCEKKSTLDKIKDKIAAAADPSALVDILTKSAQTWPDKKEFLEAIFDACAEENRNRAANGFTYDNVGKAQQWDDDDRKWVFAELTKIMDGKQIEQAPEQPVDWPSRIAAVTKSDELFTIINELADDADLTSDLNAFNAVCGLITAKLDAKASEWGDGATKISRQFLSNRITAVELDHAAKEAMNNATAS